MKNKDLIVANMRNIKIKVVIILNWIFEMLKSIYEQYITFKKNIKNIKETVSKKIINNNKNKVEELIDSNLNNKSIMISSTLKESISLDDEIFKKSEEDFINGISIDDQNENIYTIKSHDKEKYSIVNNFFA